MTKHRIPFRRTLTPKKTATIRELERVVVAWNTRLKDRVKDMNVIELLNNTHPMFRSDFAYRCRDVGLILPSEISQYLSKCQPK